MSKDLLLRQADALLAQARRMRKSSANQLEPDRNRLVRSAEEMEGKATRLEKEAASTKADGVAALPGDWLATLSKRAQTPRR
ncbi:hypothetical protein [Reyranella sp.]|uniref:hypothetical protein n=1 Tax=Reyranella sp. TaxID=1929291 RepID=UPI003D110219